MKKTIIAAINIIAVLVLLTSCTSALWKKPQYTEKFNQFYMSENGDKMIIIGKKYHYIFPVSKELKEILAWPNNNILKLAGMLYGKGNKIIGEELPNFKVTKDNKVTGRFYLKTDATQITPDDTAWLESHGFIKGSKLRSASVTTDTSRFYYVENLDGVRYLANKNISSISSNNFTREYEIKVTEEDFSPFQKGSRIMATPITVLADGTLVIAGATGMIAIAGVCSVRDAIYGKKMNPKSFCFLNL